MSGAGSDWMARAQVARAEGGADAVATFARLDAAARREVAGVGERLAGHSLSLAQAYAVRAPAVRRDRSSAAFRDWASRGESLASGEPANRDAAVAYFRIDPERLANVARTGLDRWIELTRLVTAASRRLGTAFVESTGAVIDRLGADAEPRLAAFAESATELAASGWRGEFLAAAYLSSGASTLAVLGADELRDLAGLALAVQSGRELDASVLARLPASFLALDAGERRLVLAVARRAAERSPRPAAKLFPDLTETIAGISGPIRSVVLAALAPAAAAECEEIHRLLPLLPAIVRSFPEPAREPLLTRLARLAERFPACLVPALRSLPRAAESGGEEVIAAWIERGERVAEEALDAGRAFFALESRTGLAALEEGSTAARFGEVEGVLRSYGRLLGEQSLRLREAAGASLRPFLDADGLGGESFSLPSAVSVFDSWEENFSVYKLMTANGVGRRLFGTLELDLEDLRERLPAALADAFASRVPGRTLADLLDRLSESDPLIAVFVACDGARIDRRLCALYRGFAAELSAVAAHLFRRAKREARPATAELVLYLLGAGVAPRDLASLATGIDLELLETTASILLSPAATAADALAAAILLRERLGEAIALEGFGTQMNYDELFFEQMVEAGVERAIAEAEEEEEEGSGATAREVIDVPPEQIEQTDEVEAGGVPLSAEEIRRLLEAGVILRVGRGTRVADGDGIFATGLDLAAGGSDDEEASDGTRAGEIVAVSRRQGRGEARVYEYDEWDYEIRDYRPRWCRLEEISVGSDGGEFFQQALSRHADLLPEVRRQFQRIRPERYRRIRGLEDGEDFDLNAVVEAHADLRARRTPSPRLYVARRREERDVATLFLLDMSASTDEALASERDRRPGHARRIIDVTKESLVVMAEALEEIGDQYAIYGFSGEGRKQVEFYRVKRFSEGLGAPVRGRIGAIEPKRSTRMGAALRHVIAKMRGVASRSKHVLLLSDGFPQDFDYGRDRRSNAYGIHDTMTAIQECQAAGITPFFITVDKTGHDYLRQMCETSRYLVIEDVEALPLELPKIYERWVQG